MRSIQHPRLGTMQQEGEHAEANDNNSAENVAAEDIEKNLRDEIAHEKRLIRIYEAELNLMDLSSRQARTEQQLPFAQLPMDFTDDMDHDWLETMDALQSNLTTSEDGAVELNTRWHDDPAMYRLLPLVGGIAFTSALQRPLSPREVNDSDNAYRIYELKGKVTAGNATPVRFVVVVKIEFDKEADTITKNQETDSQKAQIVGIESKFGLGQGALSAKDEFEQISKVSSKTRDLPLLFRQLVSWAEFDVRRTKAFDGWQQQYGHDLLQRLTTNKFRIKSTREQPTDHEGQQNLQKSTFTNDTPRKSLSLILSWKWSCVWYGSGEEELKLVDLDLGGLVSQAPSIKWWMQEMLEPQGLNDLVSCVGGSEKAIEVLVQTLNLSR